MDDKRDRWSKFWWDDWSGDIGLKSCSLAARGLWIEMLSIMHKAEEQGYFTIAGKGVAPKLLAGLINSSEREVTRCLDELRANNVFSTSPEGVIYSRRMVRDRLARESAKEFGRQGGNPSLKPKRRSNDEGGVNPPDNQRDNLQEAEARSRSRSRKERESARARATLPLSEKIPEDWMPTAEDVACAKAAGITDILENIEKFMDYYTAHPAPIADWSAAYRVWARRELPPGGPK